MAFSSGASLCNCHEIALPMICDRPDAAMGTLIATAKLNNVDPQAWLTDVLSRVADDKITKLDELMPWNYSAGE